MFTHQYVPNFLTLWLTRASNPFQERAESWITWCSWNCRMCSGSHPRDTFVIHLRFLGNAISSDGWPFLFGGCLASSSFLEYCTDNIMSTSITYVIDQSLIQNRKSWRTHCRPYWPEGQWTNQQPCLMDDNTERSSDTMDDGGRTAVQAISPAPFQKYLYRVMTSWRFVD